MFRCTSAEPADDVVIARRQLLSGTLIKSEGVTVIAWCRPHKVARARSRPESVRR
jgi:hypothetical protein